MSRIPLQLHYCCIVAEIIEASAERKRILWFLVLSREDGRRRWEYEIRIVPNNFGSVYTFVQLYLVHCTLNSVYDINVTQYSIQCTVYWLYIYIIISLLSQFILYIHCTLYNIIHHFIQIHILHYIYMLIAYCKYYQICFSICPYISSNMQTVSILYLY